MKEIHIAQIIEQKTGKKLSRWKARFIERLIHEKEINYILRTYGHLEGAEFLEELVAYFGVGIEWIHPERLPDNGRCLFVCNHPLGGLDGICLALMLHRKYGSVRYIVNDLLYNLGPLKTLFLPVNKYGSQRREAIERLQAELGGDAPVGSFPAGLCSRYIDGKVQDIPWQKSFVNQAITYERDIVPLRFEGKNTRHFYLLEYWRTKLGIKLNLGTALLPDEMFRSKKKKFKILVGEPIAWQSLKESGKKAQVLADEIRSISYSL
ncbi:1-acyl-sn-glycerol-3-phosphate acyltransferase [Porphyromonas macacae]|uniref:Phospholipid/glycerol acyltransferase domain-containing protein n=1 Tax=Porphyromonas macacae TaxID=28115 RepID=A0A379DJY0_9PORP|nr:1-acyl-sn-glycerol-3-phosphate acyltransferase [Porphyromonas macacae]SUB78297.1 Uncharacterised protein [Porphyromonas macacae]